MVNRRAQNIMSVLWDACLAFFIVGLTWLMPQVFPAWMALCGIPLMLCRAAIASTESVGVS